MWNLDDIINVIDIKQLGTTEGYWSMFKGGPNRSGLYSFLPFCDFGDINSDGNIDILDILAHISIILNEIEPDNVQICAADLNSDQNINLLDVIMLVQLILNP